MSESKPLIDPVAFDIGWEGGRAMERAKGLTDDATLAAIRARVEPEQIAVAPVVDCSPLGMQQIVKDRAYLLAFVDQQQRELGSAPRLREQAIAISVLLGNAGINACPIEEGVRIVIEQRDKWLDAFNASEQFQNGPTRRAQKAEASLLRAQETIKRVLDDRAKQYWSDGWDREHDAIRNVAKELGAALTPPDSQP